MIPIDCASDEMHLWPLQVAIDAAIDGYHISDQPDKYPTTIYNFIDALHDECPDIHGEPGWTIERIDLTEDFEGKRGYFQKDVFKQVVSDLKELQRQGETEAFWVENTLATPDLHTYSSQTFWLAVRESLLAFGKQRPGRWLEIEDGFRRYPQLGPFPSR